MVGGDLDEEKKFFLIEMQIKFVVSIFRLFSGIDYILVYWFCHRFFVGDVDFIELLFIDSNLAGGIVLDCGAAIINVGRIM